MDMVKVVIKMCRSIGVTCVATFAIFLISVRSMLSSLLSIPTDLGYITNFRSKTHLCLFLYRVVCCVCKKGCSALE